VPDRPSDGSTDRPRERDARAPAARYVDINRRSPRLGNLFAILIRSLDLRVIKSDCCFEHTWQRAALVQALKGPTQRCARFHCERPLARAGAAGGCRAHIRRGLESKSQGSRRDQPKAVTDLLEQGIAPEQRNEGVITERD
jgi:hypothetical protein